MTLPTTRPRAASDARYDANGTSTWAAIDPNPTKNAAAKNSVPCFTNAVSVKAAALRRSDTTISFCFR